VRAVLEERAAEARELAAVLEQTGETARQAVADPDLEILSSGQKIMIRVGPENEARLKAKLKEIRAAVVAASKPPR